MFKLILNIIYAIVFMGVLIFMIDKIIKIFKNAERIKKMPEKLEEVFNIYDEKIDEMSKRYDAVVEKSNKQAEAFSNENKELKNLVKVYEEYFKLTKDYIIGIDNEISLLNNYVNEPNEKLKYELKNLMSDRLNNIEKQIKSIETISNKQRRLGHEYER